MGANRKTWGVMKGQRTRAIYWFQMLGPAAHGAVGNAAERSILKLPDQHLPPVHRHYPTSLDCTDSD